MDLQSADPVIYAVCTLMGLGNACINPVLYGYFNENFRQEYKSLFQMGTSQANGTGEQGMNPARWNLLKVIRSLIPLKRLVVPLHSVENIPLGSMKPASSSRHSTHNNTSSHHSVQRIDPLSPVLEKVQLHSAEDLLSQSDEKAKNVPTEHRKVQHRSNSLPLSSVAFLASGNSVIVNGITKNNNQHSLKHYLDEMKRESLREISLNVCDSTPRLYKNTQVTYV